MLSPRRQCLSPVVLGVLRHEFLKLTTRSRIETLTKTRDGPNESKERQEIRAEQSLLQGRKLCGWMAETDFLKDGSIHVLKWTLTSVWDTMHRIKHEGLTSRAWMSGGVDSMSLTIWSTRWMAPSITNRRGGSSPTEFKLTAAAMAG